MRYICIILCCVLFFIKAYAVLTINNNKDLQSIEEAKGINNIAKVFINTKDGYVTCTASLINPKIMITAAHCVEDIVYTDLNNPFPIEGFASFEADTNDAFDVYFNNGSNSLIPLDAAIIHPDRESNDFIPDDIALIRLTISQERPFFELYAEDFKSQIEVLLPANPLKNYKEHDVDCFLSNCYGFGFGANVPRDAKRRHFILPIKGVEDRDHHLYLTTLYSSFFPNDKIFEDKKNFDFEERINSHSELSEKFNSSYAFPCDGDSGAAILCENRIIAITSWGCSEQITKSMVSFEFMPSLYGSAYAHFAPLFDIDGNPKKEIDTMLSRLMFFEREPKSKIKDSINEYMRERFKKIAHSTKHPIYLEFFMECAECETYDVNAWRFLKSVTSSKQDLLTLLNASKNSYALKLKQKFINSISCNNQLLRENYKDHQIMFH